MLDDHQLHALADQVGAVRDQLDAALPLAISREAIEAFDRLTNAQRVCRQQMNIAHMGLSRAVVALRYAAIAAAGPVDTGTVI